MSVRTAVLGVTFTTAEIQAVAATGEDPNGMLNGACDALQDAIGILNDLINKLPAGANQTTLQTQVTTLT